MSRLLLAKAGQIAGKRPGSLAWQSWPLLLSAERLVLLDSADESGNVDTLKEQAILEMFRCRPPAQDGENIVGAFISEEMGFPFEFPGYRVPTYSAATYRSWAGWPHSPFIAAWTAATAGQDEAAPAKPEPRMREVNRWLRDTWEAEGRPGGTAFFRALRKYQEQPGSPIRQWWQAGGKAGVEYETSAGTRGEFSRKAILNRVSEWKQTAAAGKP